MKILALAALSPEATEIDKDRTGVFTSGIISILGEHRIALFFAGHRHAGNLTAVLRRARDLDQPIRCDAAVATCRMLSRSSRRSWLLHGPAAGGS
jgi:hypothetical protein